MKFKAPPFLKRVIYIAIVVIVAALAFLKISGILDEPLSVAVTSHPLNLNTEHQNDPILKNEIISGSFKAKLDNLGIVAMRFTYNNEVDDELIFKLREKGHESWYYESTYSANLIPKDELFPFGFTPITHSKEKEYEYQLSSIKGTTENSLAISDKKPQLASKYQFTPSLLLKSGQVFEFMTIKLFGGINFSSFGTPLLIVAIVLTFLFLERKLNFEKYFKDIRIQIAIIMIISFLTAFYLVGDNLKASLGVIDDHWIAYFLGADKKASFSELPKLVLSTEVGQFGRYERFRPAYYPILVTESILWGDNPFLWYLSRLIFFAGSIAVTWYVLSRFFGSLLSYLMVLSVLTYEYWADIWTRLIPGEIFAVFGTSLFALAFFRLVKRRSRSLTLLNQRISMIIMTLGFVVAAGSKENLLILAVPLLYVFYKNKNLRKDVFSVALVGFCLLYGFMISTAIVLSLARSGQDVYSRNVSAASRLDLVGAAVSLFIERFKIFYASLGVASLGFFVFSTRDKNKITKYLVLAQNYFNALTLCGIFFITQYVFYSGQWPQNNRYDFPGILIEPFLIFFTVVIYYKIITLIYRMPFSDRAVRWIAIITLTLVVASTGFNTIQERSKTNRVQTNKFSRNLMTLTKELKGKPDLPLVVESYSVRDYEPIFSLQRYLRAYNITNPMYLRLHGYGENAGGSPLEKKLSTDLWTFSQKGSTREFFFLPLNELDNSKNCTSVVFFKRIKSPEFCSNIKDL